MINFSFNKYLKHTFTSLFKFFVITIFIACEGPDFFNPPNSLEVIDANRIGNKYWEKTIDCTSDSSRIYISLSELTVDCEVGINCLTTFKKKQKILSHEFLHVIEKRRENKFSHPVQGDNLFDPLYTRMVIKTEPKGAGLYDCNAPPPEIFGLRFLASENNTTRDYGPLITNSSLSFEQKESTMDEISFLQTICKEDLSRVDGYLSISMFEGKYYDLLSYYSSSPGECKREMITPNGVVLVDVCHYGNIYIGTLSNPMMEYFTVESHWGYVTIVQTNHPNLVFRIASDKSKFDQNIVWLP